MAGPHTTQRKEGPDSPGPNRPKKQDPLPLKGVRRCPTLPHTPVCSTIGAVRLSFRVRKVTGRFPHAITTETHTTPTHPTKRAEGGSISATHYPHIFKIGCCLRNHTVNASSNGQALGLLVPVNSTPHRASISGLSTRSSPGSLNPTTGVGVLISKQASRLDAFSGYPSRT